MLEGRKVSAVVLAGGKGKRMGTEVSKQYLELGSHPVLFYALDAFEKSIVDDVILVVAEGEQEYCRREIVEKYAFHKIQKIVAGGRERYHSVYQGICAAEQPDMIMIHDGARAFIQPDIIEKTASVGLYSPACIVGVPVKDTIKEVDEKQNVKRTLDRKKLWQVQTPQCFSYKMIKQAYQYVLENDISGITDDAMVWESYFDIPVQMIEGSYFNIKITTKEDMVLGSAILKYMSQFQ